MCALGWRKQWLSCLFSPFAREMRKDAIFFLLKLADLPELSKDLHVLSEKEIRQAVFDVSAPQKGRT